MKRYFILACLFWIGFTFAEEKDDRLEAISKEHQQYEALNKAGKYAEALPHMLKVLEGAKETFGENDESYADITDRLASLYMSMGQFADAESNFQHAMTIREKKLGTDHPTTAISLNNLGMCYDKMDEPVKSESFYQRALTIREKQLGSDHMQTAGSLIGLAELYSRKDRFAEAEPLYQRSLAIFEKHLGIDHPSSVFILNDLSIVYKNTRQFEKAEPLLQRALTIDEKQFGPDNLSSATTLNNFVQLYLRMGQNDKATPLCHRIINIYEKHLGPEHPTTIRNINSLAILYHEMGQFLKAESLYLRAQKIYEMKLGPEHQITAKSFNDLAELYREMGRYAQAEPLFLRSLAIREKQLGPEHPDIANCLIGLASLYLHLDQDEKVEPLCQRALKILDNRPGPEHPNIATTLNILASLYEKEGQYEKAEPLYKRALAIYEKLFGPEERDVASNLNNLALLYYHMEEYVKAEPFYLRALAIKEKQLGPEHPDTALSLDNLACLYREMGQYAKAEPIFRRALAIREKHLGPEHPDTANGLNNLADLYCGNGETDKALDHFRRARYSASRHIQRTLPMLSDSEQQRFLTGLEARQLHSALSMSLTIADRADVSAPWLFNGKALAAECQAERTQLARETRDPVSGDLATKLADIRGQLANAVMATTKSGQEQARFERIKNLETQEEQAAKALGHAQGKIVRSDPWVSLEDVQKALPANTVLIDIARFDIFDFKCKERKNAWKPAHYAAWITSKSDVKLVDLGDASAIDSAVQQIRVSAANSNNDPGPAMRALGGLVLAPLEKHLAGYNRWLLSPDGDLWLAPWAALPLSDGTMVIEKHCLSYLVSGRDLLRSGYNVETTTPAVFANPDFGIAAATQPAKEDTSALMITRSADMRGDLVFKPLPGTAKEAEAIRQPINDYTGAAPQLFLGANALEANAKRLTRPKVLVLSTHGFFLPEQPRQRDPRTGEYKPNPRGENPLLRCGLALAGANTREQATGENDGIFTGLEIVATDLRGTELVVLSACETGIGQINSGEGVAGLRQCFQLAGANSVVATLWQIPDTASATLMTNFFNHLSAGQPKADALRNAQLEMIARLKKEGITPHPFFWAAYTLTGK